jgi:hypothetical protein
VEFKNTITFCLENSASTETVIQLYMQDILPFLHTYISCEYLYNSGKVPFSLSDYEIA